MLNKLSLQNRIFSLVSIVTFLLMSIILWFDSYTLQRSVEETYVSQLDGMTTAINGRYEESRDIQDVQLIFDYIQYKNPDVIEMTLYGPEKVLASTTRERVDTPSLPSMFNDLAHSQTIVIHIRNDKDGIPKVRLTTPLKEDGITVGAIELLLNTTTSMKLIEDRTLFIIIVGLTITILLLIALWFIIRKMLIHPLMRIREAAISVKEGSHYKEITLDSAHEINEVASAFNEMVCNLERRYQELQHAQKQLVESEKMVALGSLVAGVSHEINTPIGIGVTAVSYMEEKSKEFQVRYQNNTMKRSDLDDYLRTIHDTSKMIQTNLHRASELIKSFKQVAVDRSIEMKRTFNVKEYIKEVLISLQPKLKKTKHQVNVLGAEGITLYNDPGAISQIITNLIMNSLIHAYNKDDEGLITLTVSLQRDLLVIHYSDNGKGMPPEVAAKIFDPFFTTNRSSGGTGLGMHIVYNLVTQSLGGTIRCQSKLGTGTSFVIQIPLKEGLNNE